MNFYYCFVPLILYYLYQTIKNFDLLKVRWRKSFFSDLNLMKKLLFWAIFIYSLSLVISYFNPQYFGSSYSIYTNEGFVRVKGKLDKKHDIFTERIQYEFVQQDMPVSVNKDLVLSKPNNTRTSHTVIHYDAIISRFFYWWFILLLFSWLWGLEDREEKKV